jgi:predicted nucleic acid-binding protein
MLREYDIVIADTSCFILLDKISELDLLRTVFGEITTTTVIADEFGKPLPEWVKVRKVANYQYQQSFENELDAGESSAFALAVEFNKVLLILDDAKARKLHYTYTGTLGILLKGKEIGVLPVIRPVLDKIQKTNFRFSNKVFSEILKEANEL